MDALWRLVWAFLRRSAGKVQAGPWTCSLDKRITRLVESLALRFAMLAMMQQWLSLHLGGMQNTELAVGGMTEKASPKRSSFQSLLTQSPSSFL
jgi:hypothetical protein